MQNGTLYTKKWNYHSENHYMNEVYAVKRIFSLLLLIVSFTISPVSAEESRVMILSGTAIYEDIQETVVLQETQRDVIAHVQSTSTTHVFVQIGDVKGFVRLDNVRTAKSMYVIRETTTKDDDDKPVTSLPFHSIIQVFDVGTQPRVQTIEGTWVERSALSDTLVTPTTYYLKSNSDVYLLPGEQVTGSLTLGQSVQGYGEREGYLRIKLDERFVFISLQNVSETPVQTGQQFVLTSTSYYQDLGQTILGTLSRGELVTVYGIEQGYARVLTKNGFVFVKQADLIDKMPTYSKTGSLYAQADLPIYRDRDKKETVGTLKRAKKIAVYGTDGSFTRVLVNGQFFFVESSKLGTKRPPYLSTGKRYVLKNTPLYSSAKSSSKTSLVFKRGQKVTIYGTSGAYTRVQVKGKYYFVSTKMMGTKKPPLYDSTGKRYIRYDQVSIYSAPSTSKRVARLKRGQIVETFGTTGYYTRIRVNKSYRYIATNYLTLNKPVAKPKAGTVFYVQFNGTPYFNTDVAYTRPAGTLKRGTKLIGIRSIDDDFWYARLSSGKRVYVTNPYISKTKPKAVTPKWVNPARYYGTTKRTAFYANPYDKKPIGYLDANRRVYPRSKNGDSYLVQYNWRPVYVKTSQIRVKQDALVKKRSNSKKERFIASAVNYLGTPYTWGSQSPRNGGFDCSGLIHYASNQAGKIGGRSNVSGYWYGSHFKNKRMSLNSGRRGDMIFFAGTYRNGPSHIGIMLSNEFFIHAGGETLQINSIHDPQWRPYFLGYKSL